MARLAQTASLEISPREIASLSRAAPFLRPGTTISVTWLPADINEQRVAAARAVRDAGFNPVSHVAARRIQSEAELRAFVKALREQADVTSAFVIGGDLKTPRGPFASSLEVIASGVLQEAGIESIGVAGYPEGHPDISAVELDQEFVRKREVLVRAAGPMFTITQFCFDPSAMMAFVRARRAAGDAALVRIGLAGPANLATLLKFAALCGVGASAKAVTRPGGSKFAKILLEAGPEPLLAALAESPDFPELRPLGVHIFPFGGFVRSAQWLAAMAEGKFS